MSPNFRGQTGTLGGWDSHDEHDGAYSVSLKNDLETDLQWGPKDGNTLKKTSFIPLTMHSNNIKTKVDSVDSSMEMCRNKHLKGVWRLPTFITLAGATHDGRIPSNMKGEAVNGTDTSAMPPSTGSPAPPRHDLFRPILSNHNNNPNESHTKESITHHQQVRDYLSKFSLAA